MAQKKSQPFRFRIPWFSSRPTAEQSPRRPKDGTKSASQPDSAIPIQQPLFNPPGEALPQPWSQAPPKKAQDAPKTEPQPQSPPHTPHRITPSLVTIESPLTSPLRSTNQIPVKSSPSRAGLPVSPVSSPLPVVSQPASEPQPPSHLPSEQPREVLKPGPEDITKPTLSPSLSRVSSRASSVISSPISKTPDASQPQFPSHVSSEHLRELLKPTTEETIQQPGPEEIIKPAFSPSPSPRQASPVSSSPISKAQPPSKPQSPSHLASEPPSEVFKPTTEEISQPAAISTSPLPSIAGSQSQASSPISKTQPYSPSHPASDDPRKELKPTAEESTQPSPSHGGSQPRASPILSSPISETQQPQSLSPLKTAAEESTQRALSPSPSHEGTQPQASKHSSPISKTQSASRPQSPSPISEASKPAAEESTQPASPALKQKEKLELLESVSQESKPKTSPLKIISKSQEHTQQDTSPTQPLRMLGDEGESAATSTTDAAMGTQVTAEKIESERTNGNSKSPSKTQNKSLLPSKEKGSAVQEPVKEGKTKAAPIKKTIRRRKAGAQAAASASGTKAKDPATRAFQADKKQQPQAEDAVERRMMFATASLTGKDTTKVVSSTDPLTRSISSSSISPQKPLLSKEEKAPLQKEIKEDISRFIEKVATSHPTESIDDIDTAFNVITLAGDNRGATMHVGLDSTKKEESVPIYRAYKSDPEERITTTDVEESSEHNSVNEDEEAGKAYVNSNIQSVNNSFMFHGSVDERDPGVKLTLPEKSDDKKQGLTCKNEFKVFRSERLNYQPTVRRRCLRGLFLEPSDSDPDNPEKPRRHGCKFRCGDNGKGKDAEIM